MDKPSGCKPLTVQFTNTTSGTNAGVTYTWNFGNGNTSTLVSPGATFIEEREYMVTLTATQGSETSTVSRRITVYKTPTASFTATPQKGCMPLEVSFASTAVANEGVITRYFWDFGDGTTQESPTMLSPKHTYTRAQVAPVSLTVTNSMGCSNTITYNNLIEVYPEVKADFNVNPKRTCTPTESIRFQNTSQAPNGTTWSWEFGDGNISSLASPMHTYGKEGNYVVKLTGTSPNGCTHTKLSDTVRIGKLEPDFTIPESVCRWNWIEFRHNVLPPFQKIRWFAGNEEIFEDWTGLVRYYAEYQGKVDITLEVDYGNCIIKRTKTLTIHPIALPFSIAYKKLSTCTIPAEYEFMDTSGLGVKWEWKVNFTNTVLSTAPTLRHSFKDTNDVGWVTLEVTTANGCVSKLQDSVMYHPYPYVISANLLSTNGQPYGCQGDAYNFSVTNRYFYPNDVFIAKYNWDFGEGSTSTEARPTHRYNNEGSYQVKLTYETLEGCTYTINYPQTILIKAKPDVSLKVIDGPLVCGNNFKYFDLVNSGPNTWGQLFFNDQDNARNTAWSGQGPLKHDFLFQFYAEGKYDATLILDTDGCYDTLQYKELVTVQGPFNLIKNPENTCIGDRLTVAFSDSSRSTTRWKWDFGDGNSKEFTSPQDAVYHTYTQNGVYKVKLTTFTDNCEVTDSTIAYVLKKQNPTISFEEDKVCASGIIRFNFSGFDKNPSLVNWTGEPDFEVSGLEYDDGTKPNPDAYFSIAFLSQLDPGKKGLRLFFKSRIFECIDTSNFAKLEIRGPKAKFQTPRDSGYCIWETVMLKDNSTAYPGVPIVGWRWDIGNNGPFGNLGTWSNGMVHKFDRAVDDVLYLNVIDEEGCTGYTVHPIKVNGTKSDFTVSSTNVAVGTTVQFTNISEDYYNPATPYWILPDGTISQSLHEAYTFQEEGEYFVKLYHVNQEDICRDTAVKKIIVRKVNAQFTHSLTYINNNGCPPALVNFTSTASNAVRYAWRFGNGATGGNQTTVNHTYTQPGIYEVWHYSWDENNNVDSSFDFIEVLGPYAVITADRTTACNNLQVTLQAEVKNANTFTWDLGDGTLWNTPSERIIHTYLTAGQYTPSLILEDEEGCKATSVLPQKIIIDSLSGSFDYSPLRICAGSQAAFAGRPQSYSAAQLNTSLSYRWLVNNGVTGNEKDMSYTFETEGIYNIQYQVWSPYGCSTLVQKELRIEAPIGAAILGKEAVCVGDTASFAAIAQATGVTWQWIIPTQPTSNMAQTAPIKWNTPGTFTLVLKADNGACTDSVAKILRVNPRPEVSISSANAKVCRGDTLSLNVNSNGINTWQASDRLMQVSNQQANVWPMEHTWFRVQALSAEGCSAIDSIRVAVVQPFVLQVVPEATACLGNTVSLSASGAASYQWQPATGLSNNSIANPVALVPQSTTYQVIGKDAEGCFVDSAAVRVTIHPQPLVNAGPDVEVAGGQAITLAATSNLDNVSWSWTPATYLSCTACPNPEAKPLGDISYTVAATTAQGCKSSDTLQVKVLCSGNNIFIPTGFTPNGDGLNDRFGVLGSGFSSIAYFTVTDRWGKVIFSRQNVAPNSQEAKWDGRYNNGMAAPSGSYIYVIKVACATGQVFDFKGQVTLLR